MQYDIFQLKFKQQDVLNLNDREEQFNNLLSVKNNETSKINLFHY